MPNPIAQNAEIVANTAYYNAGDIYARRNGTTYYQLQVTEDDSGITTWLYRVVNGVSTRIGYWSGYEVSPVTLHIEGSAITVVAGSTTAISVTDTTITAEGEWYAAYPLALVSFTDLGDSEPPTGGIPKHSNYLFRRRVA